MANQIVLYTYWRSSCSHRVRIALGYKKLVHQSVFVNLVAGAQRDASYRERSPTGYVPALEIDGHVLHESSAILEYLEETRPEPPLLPTGACERARVRALVQIIASGIQPLQNLNVLQRVSADAPTAAGVGVGVGRLYDERAIAFARHYNERGLSALEASLARLESEGVRGPFCNGEEFGMADVFLLPQVVVARRFGVDLAPYVRVMRAAEAASALDFVQAAAPESQPDAQPATG